MSGIQKLKDELIKGNSYDGLEGHNVFELGKPFISYVIPPPKIQRMKYEEFLKGHSFVLKAETVKDRPDGVFLNAFFSHNLKGTRFAAFYMESMEQLCNFKLRRTRSPQDYILWARIGETVVFRLRGQTDARFDWICPFEWKNIRITENLILASGEIGLDWLGDY